MKKIILIFSSTAFMSCNLGKCDLKGCNNKGTGWENYEDNPACSSWGGM